MTDLLIVRHPDYPSGCVAGYYSVVALDGASIALHMYEREHEPAALAAAVACSNRNRDSHVDRWDPETRKLVPVHRSRPVKHSLRASAWDGPVGTTVTLRTPDGRYVQGDR